MREAFEKLERDLERDLEKLYNRPVSERYMDVSKEMLEMELNHIESCLKTIKRITTLVSTYCDSISNELAKRENDNEV